MTELLEDYVVVDGQKVTVSLSASGVLRWKSDGNSWRRKSSGAIDLPNDVIGISFRDRTLVLHTFQQENVGCCGGQPSRARKKFVLDFSSETGCGDWNREIQSILDNSGRPKRLLILVNPFAGKTLGRKVFLEVVEPLLKVAGISYTMRETQFQLHAKDLAKSFDLSQYDGLVCVSGDGVLAEVLNGLLERADSEQAIKMPLGIVPAGSGNGMAKSILDSGNEDCNAANATFAIIRGGKQPLDIATVVQGGVRFHSLLMLSWGFVSDVDFESEKWRFLGGLRFDLQAYIRLVWLRHYSGTVSYLPAPGYEKFGDPYTDTESGNSLERANLLRNGHMSPPLSGGWRSMRGTFIYIWAQNVRYAGEDLLPAPHAKFSDGYYDLVVIRDCPRWKLIGVLLSIKDGTHVKSEYVEYVKVKAFRLTPGSIVGGSIQGGYVDLDGEILARGQGSYGDGSNDPMNYDTVDVTVQKGLATIFIPLQSVISA